LHLKFKKILPTALSVLLFSSVFVYIVLNSYDHKSELQLSPERIYYADKFGEKISYSYKDIQESGYIKNVRINDFTGVSEPIIICSPFNEDFLAVTANNFSGNDKFAVMFISSDKGLNWKEVQIPLSSKFESSFYSDPVIRFDNAGNIVFTAVQKDLYNNNRDGLCFAISSDNGINWNTNSEFIDYNSKENIHIDKPGLAVSNDSFRENSIFITWTEKKGLTSQILFARSTDGGLTFSAPIPIDGSKVKFGKIIENNNGEIFIFYLKNENEIRVKKSSDGGESWTSIASYLHLNPSGIYSNGQYLIKKTSDKGIRINSEPNVILNGNSEFLLTYSSGSGSEDQSDIYFCKFLLNTSEFTEPLRVNSDSTKNDQFLPAISSDKSGNIFIIYQDSRDDRANVLTNTYLSFSTDGGLTFIDKKLSLKSFDPGNIAVKNYIGDYNSCVFSGDELIAVWTDGRNNNFDLYAGIFNFGEFISH
jgi:hypothetical protein